ncbi:hypothetical protein QYF61_025867 [Mycteria americana]|uniref:Uncharacterized protein n=1 Tax=Mycteria americana TaxID=33587 RepID=A0AAN7SAN1_MYCAM|nr:hypothetical protein QYF61_025867 [Mycteria americana]
MGAPCSSMQASWHFCLTLSLLGCIAPELGGDFIPWYSTKQIPEEAKVCSPEVQHSELSVRPYRCPKDPELHHFMVTAAKAALELHIPHQPLLVGGNQGPAQHLSSLAPLSLGEGSYHQRIPGSSQTAYALLCCPSNRKHIPDSGTVPFALFVSAGARKTFRALSNINLAYKAQVFIKDT